MKIRRPYYNLMFSCTDQASRQHHWARRFKFSSNCLPMIVARTRNTRQPKGCVPPRNSNLRMNEGKVTTKSAPRMLSARRPFEKRADFVIKACDPHVPSLKTNLSFSSVGKWRKSYFEYKRVIMINYIHTFNRLCCIFRRSHLSLWLPCMSFH